ncbi:MAG TPA: NAD-dependent epimerase/dehydratase family protein [Verrucomicrobiae bacterium]|nr:NAD-dependent epimerase/dehydratase family protein [Verrucomicrobiae bacterium]
MRVFITGICGFVGNAIATWLRLHDSTIHASGLDNFLRPGSETNRLRLKALGVTVQHGDVRQPSDFEDLPAADWIIDAAANPSVLAGVDGITSTRRLVEHNLLGTINVLEYGKRTRAGLVLLSTSRVYSLSALASLPMTVRDEAFCLNEQSTLPRGVSRRGVTTEFSTEPPVSLYGSTKLASEILALEYADTFHTPLWINRCAVLGGGGQFGTAEQGVFSYWIHAYAAKRPLRYIGFKGTGYQVRDLLHPEDLAALIFAQMKNTSAGSNRVLNVGGGPGNAISLARLTAWCSQHFGEHRVSSDPTPRPFDIPWFVTDSSQAAETFNWQPRRTLTSILDEIAEHARDNPSWLDMTSSV